MAEPTLENRRDKRLADKAQRQVSQGDSQLNRGKNGIEVLVQPKRSAGARASGFDQLLDSRRSQLNQRKLRSNEESIDRYEQQDSENPQQEGAKHVRLILTNGYVEPAISDLLRQPVTDVFSAS